MGRLRSKELLGLTGIVAIVCIVLIVLVLVVPYLAASQLWGLDPYIAPQDPADRVGLLQAQIQVSAVLGQLLGGALLITTIFTAFRTMETTEKTLELNREQLRVSERGQVTERFTKAMEQLGHADELVRVGAVYGLEQIARDSDDLHWPIMETLSAFVRKHSLVTASVSEPRNWTLPHDRALQPRSDIQAIITVIGRRDASKRELDAIDLRDTHLMGGNFRGGDFRKVQFYRANIQLADFSGANLGRAACAGAHLQGADFSGADLSYANFYKAHLKNCQFGNATFVGIEAREADISGARFSDQRTEEQFRARMNT